MSEEDLKDLAPSDHALEEGSGIASVTEDGVAVVDSPLASPGISTYVGETFDVAGFV